MPVHDWKRVPAGIFHDFHHEWLSTIKKALNASLPKDYYALAEQITSGRFGPDVLALTASRDRPERGGTTLAVRPKPKTATVSFSDNEYYRRKKKSIAIKHVSDDRIVAVVELLSPGNKSSVSNFNDIINKAMTLLDRDIHLLLVDVFPPTARDPNGIHGAIWDAITGDQFELTPDKPLHAVSYEREEYTAAYVESFAVNDPLPAMPVFLEPDFYVDLSLEATYVEAFAATPERWRGELEGAKA